MSVLEKIKQIQVSNDTQKYFVIMLSTLVLSVSLIWLGLSSSLNYFFEEVGIRSVQTKASGQTVIINIDTDTLKTYGGHPLQRDVLASALQKLDHAGAQKIYIDSLFSYHRSKDTDAELARVMKKIGSARLAIPMRSVVEMKQNGEKSLRHILSVDQFSKNATSVLGELSFSGKKRVISQVGLNRLGVASDFPTVGQWFAHSTQKGAKPLAIDYGIALNSIPTFSLKAVLENKISADALAGKNIIIGLTAGHVGERLKVPYYGQLYRSEIIALAVETRLLNRAITTVSGEMVLVFVLMISAFLGLLLQRYTPLFGGFVSIGVVFMLMMLAVTMREKWLLNLPLFAPLLSVVLTFVMVQMAYHPAFYRVRYTLQSFIDKIDLAQIQLLNSGKDSIITFTPEGILLTMNHSAENLFNKKAAHCIGSSIADILPEHADQLLQNAAAHLPGRFQAHIMPKEQAETKRYLDMSYNAMPSDDGWVGLVSIRDISQFKAKEEKLRHAATHDSLTGLANRAGFDNYLQSMSRLAEDIDQTFAVLMIDLDKFKQVNDTLGHHVGDEVLRTVAKRLNDTLRKADFVARLGGDEFAVIMPSPVGVNGSKILAEKLVKILSEPIHCGEEVAHIGASIGIAIYGKHARTIDVLMQCADEAMYEVKKRGRNGFSMAGSEFVPCS